MAASHRKTWIRHLPVGAAIGVAIIAGIVFALLPTAQLENLVWRTGVAALVPAAQPPLGVTARAVLAIATAAIGSAVTWSALFLLVGPGGLLTGRVDREDGVPVVRRADAHPDAPPRRPMSAADLGTPMMDVSAANPVALERSIPADLDQPLAAFDPHAILPVPMAPIRPVAPLVPAVEPVAPLVSSVEPVVVPRVEPAAAEPAPVQIDAEDEAKQDEPMVVEPVVVDVLPVPPRFIFAPTPIAPRAVPAPREDTASASIESLLLRLEQGALRRRQASAG